MDTGVEFTHPPIFFSNSSFCPRDSGIRAPSRVSLRDESEDSRLPMDSIGPALGEVEVQVVRREGGDQIISTPEN